MKYKFHFRSKLRRYDWSTKFILRGPDFLRRPDWNACYFASVQIDNDPFFGNAPFAYLLGINVRHEIGKRYIKKIEQQNNRHSKRAAK